MAENNSKCLYSINLFAHPKMDAAEYFSNKCCLHHSTLIHIIQYHARNYLVIFNFISITVHNIS
jgi:hypothetical protein